MANSEMNKVGLIFSADGVADFQKSLKTVNASIAENNAAFKLAKTQWDNGTTSSQKLADKQKYLASQTEDYQKKVNVLTAELSEMENAESRDEAAISKKKAQLEQAQAQLNKYQGALEQVSKEIENGSAKIKDYADKLNAAGKKLEDIGGKMTKGITTPIAGAAAASIAAFQKVDDGLDIVTAKTGATGEALEEMHDITKNLAKSIPTDFETAGTAVGEINTRFGVTGEKLEALSEKYIKFAKINDTDLNSSIDNTQKILSAFNLTVDDAPGLLDTLNAAGQRTGIDMGTLQSSLIKNQAALKEMGLGVNESVNFLADLETKGIDSSQVMAGLQKAFVNASKDGKSMDQAMKELQEQMANATDDTEATALAMELFGNKAGPAIAQACKDGTLNFDELTSHITDDAGSIDQTFDQITDATDNYQQVLNSLMELGYEIAQAMMPLIQQAVDSLLPIIQSLTEKWNGLSPGMQDFIIKAALAAAACGPIVTGISKLIGQNGIGGLMNNIANLMNSNTALGNLVSKVFTGIQTGASKLFAMLMAHPVILIITAIVATIVILYNKCEWFRDGVNKFLADAKQAWENLKANVATVVENMRNKIQSLVDKISNFKQQASDAFNNFKQTISDVFESVKNKIESFKNKVSDTFENVKSTIKGAVDKIKGFFNFSWSLPKLKLPHISISGSFSLVPPRAPSFGIDWYAKGGILNKPTIFGMNGNSLMGGGEAGKEAVLPIKLLKDYVKESIRDVSNEGNAEMYAVVKKAIIEAFREIGAGIWLDGEKVGEIFSRKLKEELFNV